MLQRFPMDSCILSVPPDLRSPLSLVAHASSLHASGRCFAFTLQAGFCNFLPPVQGLRWIDPQHFFSFSVAGPSRSSLLSWWSLHMSAGSTCGASFFSGSIPCCDPNRVGYLSSSPQKSDRAPSSASSSTHAKNALNHASTPPKGRFSGQRPLSFRRALTAKGS